MRGANRVSQEGSVVAQMLGCPCGTQPKCRPYCSKDVNADNRGIFVTDGSGRTVLVRWADFESLVFER